MVAKKKIISFLRKTYYFFNSNKSPYKDRVLKINGKNIKVGAFTYGLESAQVFSWGEKVEVEIGRYCSISFGLKIFCGGNHRSDFFSQYPFGIIFPDFFNNITSKNRLVKTNGNIIIGNDVWIGRDVTIMSGVTIGNGAVIAANSHIVKDVEPYSIYGGNPGRFLKYRFTNEIISKLQILKWWDLPLTDQRINTLLSSNIHDLTNYQESND